MREVKTICPYCGVGCGLIVKIESGKLVGLTPDKDHPVSKGTLCPKGATAHEFVQHPVIDPRKTEVVIGVTEHRNGVDNVLSLANLAMITGNMGQKSGGLNALRGQNDVQGATDMVRPETLPGYQLCPSTRG